MYNKEINRLRIVCLSFSVKIEINNDYVIYPHGYLTCRYVVYDAESDTCHLKPIPNYIIITTNGDDVELIKRTATGSTENITLARGENKIEDIDYGWKIGTKGAHILSFDLSSFNSSKVTDMNNMFKQCSALTSLDLSKFDTSKVTDMSNMFYYCYAFTSLDLSKFDTSKVTDMNNMFNYCYALTSLDLSNWDTSQVTDMNSMFKQCWALTSLDLSNWDTSQVTDMSSMFQECSALTNLDLSKFDTLQVTDMNNMFYNCKKLNYIKCKQAFKDWCITNQTTIDLPIAMLDGGGGTWDIVDAN